MAGFKKVQSIIEKLLHFSIAVTFSVLIGACVLQVFTRFVLNNSLSWTEELARYAFIWANFLGAAVCSQKSSHATVTAITDNLPDRLQSGLRIFVNILILFICYVLIRYGFKVAISVHTQLSPALRVSMAFVYGAAPVCGIFTAFYVALHVINDIRKLLGKEAL